MRAANAPHPPTFITDEGLQRQFANHVLAAKGQAGGLRRAHVLGGGALEIGPHPYVATKQVKRVDLPGSVHQHRHTFGVGNLNSVFQGQRLRVRFLDYGVVVHGRGVGADGVF